MRLKVAVAALLWALLAGLATTASAQQRGTVGIGVAQLYDDAAPNKRGNLVVLDAPADYPGAKAGVQVGDLITEVNGVAVIGRDVAEIARNDLHGPVGATIKLKLVRPATGAPFEVTLVRTAYRPIENPASDAFRYVTPGDWHTERQMFPIEWAPDIHYTGLEDIRFAPHFGVEDSPDYWSYLFLWWVNDKPPFDARQLQSDLVKYYRGLSDGFGKQGHFTPDLGKVSATVSAAEEENSYRGTVTTYEYTGKVITLRLRVTVHPCSESDHTVVFFDLSPQPYDAPIWEEMKGIRDTFRCAR